MAEQPGRDRETLQTLLPDSHDVRIRDAANMGCFVILDPAVVIAEPVVLSATVTKSDVTCFGSTDGTITISAPAGGHGLLNTVSTEEAHGRLQETILPLLREHTMFRSAMQLIQDVTKCLMQLWLFPSLQFCRQMRIDKCNMQRSK